MSVTTKFPRWADFCRDKPRPPFVETVWRHWKHGRSRPARPILISLCVFWRVDERELLHAAHYPDQSLWQADSKNRAEANRKLHYQKESALIGRKPRRIGLDPERKRATDKAAAARRLAAKAFAKGTWKPTEWYALMKRFGYKCAYCGISRKEAKALGRDLTADHVVALNAWRTDRRLISACTNEICNIAPACLSCNGSKQEFDLLAWSKSRGLTVHPIALKRYRKQMSKCAPGPIQTDLRELMYG